jgi:hypothetical protein
MGWLARGQDIVIIKGLIAATTHLSRNVDALLLN